MLRHPDRVWRLEGATNFRDLGGYAGHDGRPLRWRRLFRSDHLGRLSDEDRAQLASLGLVRAFDFRGVSEREATPYDLPGLTQHSLAIEPTVVQRMQDVIAGGRQLSGPIVAELMRDLYRSLVRDQAARFAELFEHVIDADAPIVFHCTAGKDRTGVAAALILHALGVPHEVVMQDYLLTNEVYRRPPTPPTDTPPDALAVLWRVQESFLDAAFEVIDQEFGGTERYLHERIGLGPAAIAALRERYLDAG